VKKIHDKGLRVQVVRQYSATTPETYVFKQDPQPGEKIEKGNYVTIFSSAGVPKTDVPSVVGEPLDQALSDLRAANLKWRIQHVDNNAPQDQVFAQNPKAGAHVDQGSSVTLKVSNGPKPVIVPSVVGSTFESANSALLGAGFAVRRKDVDNDAPKDTVVAQSPDAGTYQPPGTTITLTVSRGPTTSTVPDVTSLSQADAVAQLRASGFRVKIVTQPVNDPNQDGIVQTQDPTGQAPPGTVVTIAGGTFARASTEPVAA